MNDDTRISDDNGRLAPLLVDIQGLSELLSLSRRTIERRLSASDFPPPLRLAGKRLWDVRDIEDFVDDHKRR